MIKLNYTNYYFIMNIIFSSIKLFLILSKIEKTKSNILKDFHINKY